MTACIEAIYANFGPRQYAANIASVRTALANGQHRHDVDVVLCTTRDKHLLDRLAVPASAYAHHSSSVEPMMLEFECHAVLRDALGHYDYYCFMEDDLVIEDPLFFSKISWFAREMGTGAVLMPNRYERDGADGGRKLYLDGQMSLRDTRRFQDVTDRPVLARDVLDHQIVFRRPSNPHAACFFLSAEQMDYWTRQPYFLDRDTSFIGPLESAATLGIMRTFRLYKAARECANFLEIWHASPTAIGALKGDRFASRRASKVRLAGLVPSSLRFGRAK